MSPSAERTCFVGSSRCDRVADSAFWTVLCLATAFSALQILLYKFGRDQGVFAVVADTMLSGGMPYRDAWDFKPPGIFFVYALAQVVFGPHEWSIRVVQVCAFLSLIPIMGVLAKRFFGDARIGWVGGALALWIEAQLEFWHSGQPEAFGGVLALGGLAVSTHPAVHVEKKISWKPLSILFLAGGLFGTAGLMKPHILGVAAAAAIHAAWHARASGTPTRKQLAAFFTVVAGTCCTVGACALWFVVRGAWPDLYQTLFVFAPGYAMTTWRLDYFAIYCHNAAELLVAGYSSILPIGLILSVALGPRSTREREGMWLLIAACLPQVLGIAVQSKFYPYHFGSAIPFCALLAAPGLWKAWQRSKNISVAGPLMFFCALWFAAIARTASTNFRESFYARSWKRTAQLFADYRHEPDAATDSLYNMAEVNYRDNLNLAEWIVRHTEPLDTTMVWGFEPHVYFASRSRRPATRFIYNVPQRSNWDNKWARDTLMEDIRRSSPAVVAVEHGDVFSWMTGNNMDSAQALKGFPELNKWMDNYEIVENIGSYDIYVRRNGSNRRTQRLGQ